jgi:hypothetical protein
MKRSVQLDRHRAIRSKQSQHDASRRLTDLSPERCTGKAGLAKEDRPGSTRIGPCLRVGSVFGLQTEADFGMAMLNRMLSAGRPDIVRCLTIAA